MAKLITKSFLSSSESESDSPVMTKKKCSNQRTSLSKKHLSYQSAIKLKNSSSFSDDTFDMEIQGSSSATPSNHSTPKSSPFIELNAALKELKEMVSNLVKQNEALNKRVDDLSEDVQKKKKQTVEIPNDVRYHVKMAYKEMHKQNVKEWVVDNGFSVFDQENLDTTKYIKNFVSGLHPSQTDEVINAAIKTYYESKKTLQRKKGKNNGFDQNKAQRKIHKASRLQKGLEKATDISEEEKINLKKVLVPELMSSEEELFDDNSGIRSFKTKKPAWRSKKYQKLVDKSAKLYAEHCSKRSRDQTIKRVAGSPSKRPAPVLLLSCGFEVFKENGTP